MKRLYILCLALLSCVACSVDEDEKVTTSGPATLSLHSSDDIVLELDNGANLGLTVYWTDNNNITLSGSYAAASNVTVNTLQFSASDAFTANYDYLTASGSTSAQFTVKTLNNITSRLGMKGGVSAPLYMRMASKLGDNMTPDYSNVVSINVTPYLIDMSSAEILDENYAETGVKLAASADGVYEGFMAASSWYNFLVKEGDGTIWGGLPEDGKPFYISSSEDRWKCWFPSPAGSYYSIINTGAAEWSALYLPTINVTGDITGEMTFDRKTNLWTLVYTATAGTATVQLSGTGKQYNTSTKTDDDAAVSTAFGFAGTESAVTFGSSASDISVTVSASGESTLTLDLTNMTLSVVAGSSTPEETPKYLYMSGIDDGISGSWTFDNYLVLYDEDHLSYAGCCNVNSLWGYMYYAEKDNWDSKYGMETGDAASGTLVKGGGSNVTAPAAGMYL
nr:DUF5114 domain-containing protein [Bacteroidales bacterium]